MAILTSLHHRIYMPQKNQTISWTQWVLRVFDHEGMMRGIMIVWILVAVFTYLIAIYFLFGLGVAFKEKSAELKEITDLTIITELNLQQSQTEFVKNNQDILASMEKISDMHYILPTDRAVSQADSFDQKN